LSPRAVSSTRACGYTASTRRKCSIAAALKARRRVYSGVEEQHSLRSGFATTAARAGVAEHKIMRQGRWNTSQAMRGYIQEGELFVDNPSAKLGL